MLRKSITTVIVQIGVNTPHKVEDKGNHGDVIGTGSNHLISTQHLDQRQAMFEANHREHLKYLPQEDGFSMP